jgi:hypothetical protein
MVIDSDGIDASLVLNLTKVQGLAIAVERMPAVAVQFARIAEIAGPLLAVELLPDDEAGPVWRP